MNPVLLIIVYSLAVVVSSLFGGWLPTVFRLTHVRMQVVLSFVGGMMLGVGVLHMLPHSYVETGSLDRSLLWMMVGLIGMFLLIRMFHFHEHGPAFDGEEVDAHAGCDHDHHHHHAPGHEHPHAHDERHESAAQETGQPTASISSVSWLGVMCGLSLHAFLDGVALAAGVLSDWSHRGQGLAGLGVFVAILFHKPLDALSITTLMQARSASRQFQQAVNAGFAMMCPAGALLFAVWAQRSTSHVSVGIALAVSAGVFLCISLSDLLPEVQFHRHDRLKLSAALVAGVLCAYAVRWLEPPHAHHLPSATATESGHGERDEHEHDHGGDEGDPGHDDHHDHDEGHGSADDRRAVEATR